MDGQLPKKEKSSVKIHIPSPSDFADLEEELNKKKTKREPAKTRCGLLDLLPPPKSAADLGKKNSFVPHVLTKKSTDNKDKVKVVPTKPIVSQVTKSAVPLTQKKPEAPVVVSQPSSSLSSLACYYSDSENEEEEVEEKDEKDEMHTKESTSSSASTGMDFFSLSSSSKIPDEHLKPISTEELNEMAGISTANHNELIEENARTQHTEQPGNLLTSTVMNLPREEIILKNKVEFGPKLPIPEQEYHVDQEGNVAFDDKAIEYLCGKRGVKRKKEFSNVDIVEINGEDMKPDEREWLVKALTEEQVVRPVSANSGPGGASKKKHQITYLAHQAKAMELELKNQWAHNKSARQQCRSKYGF
ncbi:proline-rich protein PRCC [Trichogramma pretiosum]|uniref:proline-rich protein PRCC n=1 Tax=Trichogramma pretiosum TaxID=7493 RepID=UPI0006C95D4A|nr:proline-rich protein PRCC [Trichogramma pretiosum]